MAGVTAPAGAGTTSAAEATTPLFQAPAAEAGKQPASAAEATPPVSDEETEATRRARHWEREASKANKSLAALTTEVESLRAAQQSDHEKALTSAHNEGRTEASKEWQAKYAALAARTEALQVLGGRVTHPELFMPLLDLSGVELDNDGKVLNPDLLEDQVDALVEKYGDLAVTNGSGSVTPHPHADLGPRRTPPRTKSTSDELREAMGGGRRRP